jgi:polyene glycosyltransferase
LSNKMTFFQKVINRLFTVAMKLMLLSTGIQFMLKRIRTANISMQEAAEDPAGVNGCVEYIVDTVFGFEYPFPLPDNCTMIGACFDADEVEINFHNHLKGGHEPTLTWLQEHKTVIYIGLGTITKPSKTYSMNLLHAFQKVRQDIPDIHLLFKVPEGCFRPDSSDTICDHVRFVDHVHSQLEVLRHPHVKVFVSHCGGNGVHEGIYYGKAILGIPQWCDCFDFAQRVEDAGVGLRVKQTIPTVSVNEVASKLLQLVVDDQYRVAATRLSDKMKAAGGIRRAVELIEKTMKI